MMKLAELISQYLSAIGTIIIGAVVAYIAWHQYRTSHDKFRLDLFEKRHAIYRALMEFLGNLDSNPSKTGGRIMTFRADTNDARFLFDDDVVKFLSEVYSNAWRYQRLNHKLLNIHHKDYPKWVNEEAELLKRFDEQMKKANEVFAPYLTFKDRRTKIGGVSSNKLSNVFKSFYNQIFDK